MNDSDESQAAANVRFEWRLACGDKTSATDQGSAQPCAGTISCPPNQHLYRLWQVAPPPETPLGIVCAPTTPRAPAAGLPQLTPAMVAHAFEKVPLPALATQIQPGGKTLVNFDTIFFTRATPIDRTLVLLGQQVQLAITPASFTWSYGDGTTQTTATPGAAYPAKDVVHRYQQAHITVGAHVTVTWTARFRTTGGWQDVPGTVTTVGPDTTLRIAEATPALSGQGH